MATCEECKSFFPLEEDPLKGDCVTREDDGRSQYWMARPTEALMEVGECPRYISKGDATKQVADLAGQGEPIVDKKVITWK